MEIKPDVSKLMKRDAFGYGLFTLIILLVFWIIQLLVVNLDAETSRETFARHVWPWPIGGAILMWLIWPGIAYLWYINLRYVIKTERLIIHKGILNKKEVSVPFRAVTDFTLRRGFFERKLDIGALLVQTAGQSTDGTGYEAKLEGLINYEELHTELRARIKQVHPTGVDIGLQDEAGGSDTLGEILKELKALRSFLENKT